ncbi:MAG: hypothetical protein OEU26_00135 [Candidatus Tectomicrobia bacterium]|nr:hypothetical protein [Candidatus Tectomicrobia bacterium]
MADASKTVYVEFVADMRKLAASFDVMEKKIGKLGGLLVKLGLTLGGIFSARLLASVFKNTILDSSELIQTARSVGVTAAAYEKLSFVLEKSLGASAGTTEKAIFELQGRLGAAGRQYDKFFKAAGIDPNKLRGASPAEQVIKVTRALTQIQNQSQRTALAGQLLGKQTAAQILRAANAGTEELEKAEKIFDRFGPLIKPEDEASLIRANQQLEKMGMITARFKQRIVQGFLTEDNLSKLSEGLDTLGKWVLETDNIKQGWVIVGGVVAGVAAAIVVALGPASAVVAAVIGISALVTSLIVNWDDLRQAIKLVYLDAERAARSFAKGIYGSLNPFMDTATGPTVPLDAPPLSIRGFNKNISGPGGQQSQPNYYITQNLYGLTAEQVDARNRRLFGVTLRGD